MASVVDCAALALDVYDRGTGPRLNYIAAEQGWTRVDGQNWSPGFAAGVYRKDEEVVIAYRGTDGDDPNDILSDAQMVPRVPEGTAQRTLDTLVRRYGVSANGDLAWLPGVVEAFAQLDFVQSSVREYANRIPQSQSRQALAYFDQCQPAPSMVVGHSLGGALAKIISLQRSLLGIAFNSPFMGDLQGVAPMSSAQILSINTEGDPLSLATRAAGNLGHGRNITITVPQPEQNRPRPPRRPSTWQMILFPIPTMIQQAQRRLQHQRDLLSYLAMSMGHYHSMANLYHALQRGGARFRTPLEPGFRNL